MQDYGTRKTDLAVNRAEWRLSRVYSQAVREIEEKTKAWEKAHEAREKRYREEVKQGKLSQADFDAWLRGQVFQGQQWQARKAELQRVLYNADQAANKIVNEGKLGVFAQNANFIGYQLDHGGKVNSGFTLYDENTVARLIKSDPQILPKAAPGVQKDKAYTYYNKLINSAITQGIVQGETIADIARRIAEKTGESAYTSAIRNARTAYTGAQNAGRIEGLHQAQALGINVKKQWMATLDSKTRDTHADLDGQVRDVDEPFEVDGMTIDYPGDPTADPSLVYNCRCTLVYVYPDYPSDIERRDAETGEKIGDMSYREWEAWKAEGRPEAQPEPEDAIRHHEFTPATTIAEAEQFARQFLQHADSGVVSYKNIDIEYANKFNGVLNDVFGEFTPKYKLDKIAPMNAREKIFKSIINSSEACYHWSGNGGMYFNPTFYKSVKVLQAHKDEIDKLMKVCLEGGQKLIDSGKYTGAKRDYIEALLRTGRQCVSQSHDFVEGTVVHECGHMLDDKIFRKVMRELDSPLSKINGISDSREKYGGGISGYAISSNNEYIAESFTAWWYGEKDKLDPELVRVFTAAKKYGKE